jgi:hypothetical protein
MNVDELEKYILSNIDGRNVSARAVSESIGIVGMFLHEDVGSVIPASGAIYIDATNQGISGKTFAGSNVKNIKIFEMLYLLSVGALSAASAVTAPWLVPFAAIVLIQESRKVFEKPLGVLDSIVLYTFAHEGKIIQRNNFDGFVAKCTFNGEKYGEAISAEKVRSSISRLAGIGIVVEGEKGICLVDSVKLREE